MKKTWQDDAKSIIKKHEGLKLKLYKCPANKWTIGVGHNIEDNGISSKVAEMIYEEDFLNCVKTAEEIFGKTFFNSKIKDNAKMVIVDMIFNLGSGKFLTFRKFIKAIRNLDYASAGKEIINSKAYTQNMKRYKELAKLIQE